MKRLLVALVLVIILVTALTPVAAHAGPIVQEGDDGDGGLDVGAALGTLGLYAAMMAVLAVGTEVVVDVVRPVFGLHSKTTAQDAFANLQTWLPGMVKDLGLSKGAEARIQRSIRDLEELTKSFEQEAEKTLVIVEERWAEILKDLAVRSADLVVKEHWAKIEPELEQVLDPRQVEIVHAWLVGAINRLSGVSPANLESHLALLNDMLEEVERQREGLQSSPARRLWRYLRTAPWSRIWLGRFMTWFQFAWDWLRDRLPDDVRDVDSLQRKVETYRQYLSDPHTIPPVKTLREAGQRVLELEARHKQEEKRRITWLRVISVVVGIFLAVSLQVNTFQLLEPVLGSAADTFRVRREDKVVWYSFEQMIEYHLAVQQGKQPGGEDLFDPTLGLPWVLGSFFAMLFGLKPGIVLSGIGAAAGSGFWHDQLDRVREAKSVVSQVEEVMKQFNLEESG